MDAFEKPALHSPDARAECNFSRMGAIPEYQPLGLLAEYSLAINCNKQRTAPASDAVFCPARPGFQHGFAWQSDYFG